MVKMNQLAEYLGQRSFRSKVIDITVQTDTHTNETDCFTWTTKAVGKYNITCPIRHLYQRLRHFTNVFYLLYLLKRWTNYKVRAFLGGGGCFSGDFSFVLMANTGIFVDNGIQCIPVRRPFLCIVADAPSEQQTISVQRWFMLIAIPTNRVQSVSTPNASIRRITHTVYAQYIRSHEIQRLISPLQLFFL